MTVGELPGHSSYPTKHISTVPLFILVADI
jgi:hypothetical protein